MDSAAVLPVGVAAGEPAVGIFEASPAQPGVMPRGKDPMVP